MKHNLLPKEQKKELRVEYITRALNVCLALLTATTLLGAIALIPAYIKVTAELSEITLLRDQEAKPLENGTGPAPQAILTDVAYLLAGLQKKNAQEPVTATIDKVFSARPEGVLIQGISFERGTRNFSVEGIAATRDALVLYRRTLEEQSDVGQVTNPISNLAKNANLPFQLSFVIGQTASSTP